MLPRHVVSGRAPPLAVDKAYENNMPKDNVERAVKRGVGGLDGANYEQIRYEG